MSTANSEYLQVWGQVKQWPVELRQNLAEDISKSVESDLPAAHDPWNEAKNARRCELIDQEIQGTLNEAGKRELDLLMRQMRAYRRSVAPIPMEAATQIHQQLLEKKRHAEGSLGEEL